MAGRVFAVSSEQAWALVEPRLKELGLPVSKADPKNQLSVTQWRDFGSDALRWLPALDVGEQHVAKRVAFQVFVSPFAEPARVYVASVTEFKRKDGSGSSTVYNLPPVNEALMKELARVLGQENAPIPSTLRERQELSRSFLGERLSGCAPQVPCGKTSAGQPQRIAASALAPADLPPSGKARRAHFELDIREDGAVTGVRLVGPPIDRPWEAAQMGPLSLSVFTPPRVCGCPAETVIPFEIWEETGLVVAPR